MTKEDRELLDKFLKLSQDMLTEFRQLNETLRRIAEKAKSVVFKS